MAYEVILEPGIGQFRAFEFPRVHSRINSYVKTFSCAQINLRKARERELATPEKMKARTRGKGRHMWPRLVQKLESRNV